MFKYFVKQFIAIPAKTPLATIVYSLCVWKKILAKNCFFNDDFFLQVSWLCYGTVKREKA